MDKKWNTLELYGLLLYVSPTFVNFFASENPHMPEFTPLKQTRASDTVMKQLKDAIVTGKYIPGQKLPSERELTQAFQVSRVVVREAIRALEFAGFVDIRQGPHGGAFIRELGFERVYDSFFDLFTVGRVSVVELMQARQLIQPEIARMAALNVTPEYAGRLNRAITAEIAPKTDHTEMVKGRMVLDHILAEMCENRLYRAITEPLIKLTREIILTVKPEETQFHDPTEHKAIAEAVLSGNAPAAAAAMGKHLNTVGAGLTKLEKEYRRQKGIRSDIALAE